MMWVYNEGWERKIFLVGSESTTLVVIFWYFKDVAHIGLGYETSVCSLIQSFIISVGSVLWIMLACDK